MTFRKIKKVKISNFQSIKSATFDLGNITVLKADSDVGKSAIVRAFRALTTNSFKKEYAHYGNLPCGIAVVVEDSELVPTAVVGLRNEKGFVEYKINKNTLTKLQSKVPEEISNLLFKTYEIDKDLKIMFNISGQFDRPFLLDSSETELSKILGRISNLDRILVMNRRIIADKQANNTLANDVNSRIVKIKTELEQFKDLPKKEIICKKLKKFEGVLTVGFNKKTSCGRLVDEFLILENKVSSVKKELKKFEKLNEIKELAGITLAKSNSCDAIENLLFSIDNVNKNIETTAEEFKRFPNITKLRELVIRLDKIVNSHTAIIELLEKEKNIRYNVNELVVKIESIDLEKLYGRINKVIEFHDRVKEIDKKSEALLYYQKSLFSHNKVINETKSLIETAADKINNFKEELNEYVAGIEVCPLSKLPLYDNCKKALVNI